MTPRVVLRQEEVDEMYRDSPVRTARFYVVPEDWASFTAVAYQGMEIPVGIEGSDQVLVAVLLDVRDEDQSLRVVI